MKLTEAQKRALAYIAEREPVGLFPFALALVRRLEKAGFIESLPAQQLSFVSYQLTEAGRAALREKTE